MYSLILTIAVIVYVWIAVRLTRPLIRRAASGWAKWGIRLGSFLVFFSILQGDELAGLVYFNHLCSTEAGVKVYQTVELPAEYWDGQGKPKFSVNGGADNRQTVFAMDGKTWEGKRFLYSSFTERYNQSLHVEKAGFRLSDRETGRVFGEVLYFRYWGGWLARNFSPHNSAASCEIKNLDGWEYNIFKPATSTR